MYFGKTMKASRRTRAVSLEAGGLPLVFTLILLAADSYADSTDSSNRCTHVKCSPRANDNLNLDSDEVPRVLPELLASINNAAKNEDYRTSSRSSPEKEFDSYEDSTDSSDGCTDVKCSPRANDNLDSDSYEVSILPELPASINIPAKIEDSKTFSSSSSEEELERGGKLVEDPALDWTVLVYNDPLSWMEAGNQCRGQGAVLASPVNQKALRNMKYVLNKYIPINVPVITGIRSTDFNLRNQEFLLYREEDARSVDWSADSTKHAECLTMTGQGVMGYVSCNTELSYVCFKKRQPRLTRPCIDDSEYEYDASTGSCYKFHRVAANWKDASRRCNSEGAHLAVINSPTEADVLVSIMADNPVQTLVGTTEHRFATIGFKAVGDHDTWRTVFGTSLEEEGYATFADGEPNNQENEYCGAVYRSGYLNDVPCNYQYAYICEKNDNRTITTTDEIISLASCG